MKILNTLKPMYLNRRALASAYSTEASSNIRIPTWLASISFKSGQDLRVLELKDSVIMAGPRLTHKVNPKVINNDRVVAPTAVGTAYNDMVYFSSFTRVDAAPDYAHVIKNTFGPVYSDVDAFYNQYMTRPVHDTGSLFIYGASGSTVVLHTHEPGDANDSTAALVTPAGSSRSNIAPKRSLSYIRYEVTSAGSTNHMGRSVPCHHLYTRLAGNSSGWAVSDTLPSATHVTIYGPDAEACADVYSTERRDRSGSRTFSGEGVELSTSSWVPNCAVRKLNLRLKDVHFNKVLL